MMGQSRRGSWLREPLLHFLLIGAGLFLVHAAVKGDGESAPRDIVVSDARIEALAENFSRTWMRAPTPPEMYGLVDDYVKEEIYYREAVAMGLDADDSVIRRRLRQKMEFVTEDAAATSEPTDAELAQFLAEHPEKFLEPARVTFEQVFLSIERRGAAASSDAEQVLADLQAGHGPADPADAGDPTLLPAGLEAASPRDVGASFGEEFATLLEEAPVGQWSGPLPSSFGLHLVRVTDRVGSSMPKVEEIRPVVEREWQAEQRQKLGDEFYRSLRARYEVHYEGELGRMLQTSRPAAGNGPT
jgi:hypothetical protein